MDGTGEYHLVKLARKAKNCVFSSYAEFRPKTKAVILLNMGHMLRGEHLQEE
jgi:hypothetical protein